MHLILASASPRRAELLRAAGYEFEVWPVDIDERVKPGEPPSAYVERLAVEKSARAMHEIAGQAKTGQSDLDLVVLGADTAVVIDQAILGKPLDVEDGARMLRRLSGRTHEVMTGVSLRSAGASVPHVEVSTVTFATLTEEEIAWYSASGEGRDKAGGYAIQGLASRFIPRIEGSYSNIVGLPIAALKGLILRLAAARSLLASGE